MEWWETDLLKLVENEPEPRKIYWIYDEIGGCGKSTFFNYL